VPRRKIDGELEPSKRHLTLVAGTLGATITQLLNRAARANAGSVGDAANAQAAIDQAMATQSKRTAGSISAAICSMALPLQKRSMKSFLELHCRCGSEQQWREVLSITSLTLDEKATGRVISALVAARSVSFVMKAAKVDLIREFSKNCSGNAPSRLEDGL
jgi:hypothetical protein